MNTEEIWRDIRDYEGLYQVSNWGRVRSLDKLVNSPNGGKKPIKSRIIKQLLNKQGYYQVGLWKNGERRCFRVHQLVAMAFIPNPENKRCIDHINGVRDDNRAENLRYCTKAENNGFQLARLNQSKAQKINQNKKEVKEKKAKALTNNHKTSKAVMQLTLNGDFVAEFPSIGEAARQTGFSRGNIANCCEKRSFYNKRGYLIHNKSVSGFVFKFKNEREAV